MDLPRSAGLGVLALLQKLFLPGLPERTCYNLTVPETLRVASMFLMGDGTEVTLDATKERNVWAKANDWYERFHQEVAYQINFSDGGDLRGSTTDYPGGTFAQSVYEFLSDLRTEMDPENALAKAFDADLIDFGGQRWAELNPPVI